MKKIYWMIVLFAMIVLTSGSTFFAANTSSKSSANVNLWKFKTSGKIMATPLIDSGVLYVGSLDSSFYALDAATGAKKWSYKTQDQIFGNAVKYQNIICFESGQVLYGLDLQGTLVWKFTLYGGTFLNMQDEWDYYHSSPLLDGNVVYIGSEKGLVYGIDIRDGSKVFQCQAPTAKFTVKTTPITFDNKIYFGDWDGVFYAYDLITKSLVWQYDTKQDNAYSGWINAIVTDPLILDGYVYFGGRSCSLYCLDAKTGTRKWKFHDSNDMWVIGGPTINGGTIYTGSSYQHVVRALDLNTGNLKWEKNVDYRVNGKPVVDGDNVYVGTEHDTDTGIGTLLVLDKNTGAKKERLNLGTQIYSTPLLQNGIIYVGAANGFVYALSQNDLLNMAYPDTYLPSSDLMNIDKLKNDASFVCKIPICNKGAGADSITISFNSRSPLSAVKARESAFKLAAHDSQSVSIIIDPTTLSIASHTYVVYFTSNWSFETKTLSRSIRFSVEQSTGIESNKTQPVSFSLNQNYPNPFNPATNIVYQLPNAEHVTLKVFDLLGNEVATLVNEYQSGGEHKVVFNSQSIQGNYQCASGIYFYRFQAGDKVQTRKLVLMK